jgi:hypothetical protein
LPDDVALAVNLNYAIVELVSDQGIAAIVEYAVLAMAERKPPITIPRTQADFRSLVTGAIRSSTRWRPRYR